MKRSERTNSSFSNILSIHRTSQRVTPVQIHETNVKQVQQKPLLPAMAIFLLFEPLKGKIFYSHLRYLI